MAEATAQQALQRGLAGRCPHCGRGRLFSGYLKVVDACRSCGAPFHTENSGDGAAAFLTLAIGAIAVPMVLLIEFGLQWPIWINIPLTCLVATGLVVGLLPPSKGALIALELHHGAQEGRLASDKDGDREW